MNDAIAQSYSPSSRRPIADVWRTTAGWATRACVAAGISPNLISCLSVVFAAGAAACFLAAAQWPISLFFAPLACLLRLWLNMLDGMVALAANRASRRGEIFNELPDRISDVLIFASLAASGLVFAPLGYWAAILAVMTAYVGTLGQAVAGHREYRGIMSKQWRMFTLAAATWSAAAAGPHTGRLVLNAALILIIAGCVQTIWLRLAKTFGRLDAGEVHDVA